MRKITFYEDKMDSEELSFLKEKRETEAKQFYKVANVLMILCFVIPFLFSWFKAVEGKENEYEIAFMPSKYFGGVGFLLVFVGGIMYAVYRRFLHKLEKDIKTRSKTVEHTHIQRKQFMPHDKRYYFYLDSPTKLSIEVSEQDYVNMREGDELSIEYSTNYKFYFGYF